VFVALLRAMDLAGVEPASERPLRLNTTRVSPGLRSHSDREVRSALWAEAHCRGLTPLHHLRSPSVWPGFPAFVLRPREDLRRDSSRERLTPPGRRERRDRRSRFYSVDLLSRTVPTNRGAHSLFVVLRRNRFRPEYHPQCRALWRACPEWRVTSRRALWRAWLS